MSLVKIKSILTLENHFKRVRDLDFDNLKDAVSNMNIDIEKNIKDETEFSVTLTVSIDQKFEGAVLVEGNVVIVGVFQTEQAIDSTTLENFTKINGPAILFPFAREYFSSTSLKCLIPPIILPPVNFVEKHRLEREKEGKVID